jgi:hypothetical protein
MELDDEGTFTLLDSGYFFDVVYKLLGAWHDYKFYDCSFNGRRSIVCVRDGYYQILGLFTDYPYFDILHPFDVPFCPLRVRTDSTLEVIDVG